MSISKERRDELDQAVQTGGSIFCYNAEESEYVLALQRSVPRSAIIGPVNASPDRRKGQDLFLTDVLACDNLEDMAEQLDKLRDSMVKVAENPKRERDDRQHCLDKIALIDCLLFMVNRVDNCATPSDTSV